MIWLIILEVIVLIIMIIFVMEFWQVVFLGAAPFLSSTKEVLSAIKEKVVVKPGQKVYELGSGKALFLRELSKKYPQGEYIGIEKNILPYTISRLTLAKEKHKIKILKKDIFKTKLQEADIIYCYLNPKMMARLADKIDKECRPGTLIISYMFSLPNKEIKEEINLKRGRIYFYEV